MPSRCGLSNHLRDVTLTIHQDSFDLGTAQINSYSHLLKFNYHLNTNILVIA